MNAGEWNRNKTQLIRQHKSDSATVATNCATFIKGANPVAFSTADLAVRSVLTRHVPTFDCNSIWECSVWLARAISENTDVRLSVDDRGADVCRRVVAEVITRIAPDTCLFDGIAWIVDIILCRSWLARLSFPVGSLIGSSQSVGGTGKNVEWNGHFFVT